MFLLAIWMGRESQVLLTLAVAAWLILLHDPQAIFDISFQLSFISVLAIAVVLQRRPAADAADTADTEARAATRMWTWIKSYGLMTGAVTVATAPLVAHYFNQVPWAGLVGNLFVVPIAGFVLVPIGLVSAIGCLLTGGNSLPLAEVNQAIGDALFRIVDALAAVPFSEWHVASPSVFGLSAFYICLVLSLWFSTYGWVRRSGAVVAMVLMVWWIWSPHGWSDGDTLRVTFLDVGQGDACLIELPDRQTILIDGGSRYDTFDVGRAVVAPYLWDRGITHLDHVVGTHPQLDHVGGLAWTVQKFSVGHFWSNGMTRDEASYQRLQTSLRLHHIDEQTAEEGQFIVDSPACRLRVLNPRHADQPMTVADTKHGSLLNNRSVVTRLDCGPHSFLFTADIETDTIARLRNNPWFQARVVKVPHHGGRSSLDDDWIAHLRPEVAVISVGRMNPYGHPAAPVLAAYERTGARVLRTDRDGAIQVTASLSSPDLAVRRARGDVVASVGFGAAMLNAEIENLRRLWRRWTAI
jgi:competence protein ComEC